MATPHYDSLRGFLRSGDLPVGLDSIVELIQSAEVRPFNAALPEDPREIFGHALGSDLVLPSAERPVAMVDQSACVLLWTDNPEYRVGLGDGFCFLHASYNNALSTSDVEVVAIGNREEVRKGDFMIDAWRHSLQLDWGVIS